MKIGLVSLPWKHFDLPSASLGALAAYVRKSLVDADVDVMSEHVTVWSMIGDIYNDIVGMELAAELLYASLYYDIDVDRLSSAFRGYSSKQTKWILDNFNLIEPLKEKLASHAMDLSQKLAENYDIVGFTTSFSQLFSSLYISRLTKEINKEVVVIFGGSASSVVGNKLREVYSYVDYVVVGEGEEELVRIIRGIKGEGIIDDSVQSEKEIFKGDSVNEVLDLNILPIPDYDEFFEKADIHSIFSYIPVEASRGCWWDRRKVTSNIMNACHFCGLNGGVSRRDKDLKRIAQELAYLSSRHQNTRVVFVDNLVRKKDITKLSETISGLGIDFEFSLEIRSNISSLELLSLRLAGLLNVQIGIEGLSSSYLKRLNKGVGMIDNLNAMRLCYELDIQNSSNLITDFPGATEIEVSETAEVIKRAAVSYEPLRICEFVLDPNSAVFRNPEYFGVKNVRNHHLLASILPPDVIDKITFPWLEFESDKEKVSWEKVLDACGLWGDLHTRLDKNKIRNSAKPLFYYDGHDFLEIVDRRNGFRLITLDDVWRSLYMYCMEIRSLSQVIEQFAKLGRAFVEETLEALCEQDLVIRDGERFLSLAVADRRENAAKRIASYWCCMKESLSKANGVGYVSLNL